MVWATERRTMTFFIARLFFLSRFDQTAFGRCLIAMSFLVMAQWDLWELCAICRWSLDAV
jgi:hypothetical protein